MFKGHISQIVYSLIKEHFTRLSHMIYNIVRIGIFSLLLHRKMKIRELIVNPLNYSHLARGQRNKYITVNNPSHIIYKMKINV